jgi:hypothetical protein
VLVRYLGLVGLTLIIPALAQAGDQSVQHRFLTSREPTSDYYAYIGADWLGLPGKTYDRAGFDAELTAITSHYTEFGIDTSVLWPVNGGGAANAGDTSVRIAQGYQPKMWVDYVSLAYTEVLNHGPANLSDQLERTAQFHAQGGATLLGWDITASYLQLVENAGFGNRAFAWSFGYRGQIKRSHIGIDFAQTHYDSGNQNFLELAFMNRKIRGDSFYALAQIGLTGSGDAWSISAGYEFKIR